MFKSDDATNMALCAGGAVYGISASFANVPLATISCDPVRPSFTDDFKMPKTHNPDILRAYKDRRIDGRWFKYLLPT